MPRLTSGRPGGAVAVLLALATALPGCSAPPAAAPAARSGGSAPAESGPAVELVSADLEDTQHPQAGDVVAWTTTWRACFAPGRGDEREVVGWQTRAVTSEGASPEVADLLAGCIDLDVATGVGPADGGMTGREIQLSDARSLAYRVRAVHADGSVTPWTQPVRVGTETSAG